MGRTLRLTAALLNWVGAEFMIKGYLSYPQMLQVFNLVLFSLTFGTAMLDFSECPKFIIRPRFDSSQSRCWPRRKLRLAISSASSR